MKRYIKSDYTFKVVHRELSKPYSSPTFGYGIDDCAIGNWIIEYLEDKPTFSFPGFRQYCHDKYGVDLEYRDIDKGRQYYKHYLGGYKNMKKIED